MLNLIMVDRLPYLLWTLLHFASWCCLLPLVTLMSILLSATTLCTKLLELPLLSCLCVNAIHPLLLLLLWIKELHATLLPWLLF